MPARRPQAAAGEPMEAVMIGTLVIILAAVVAAVLGCAWVAPDAAGRVDAPTREHRT
jgi:hypothetical protein